MAVPSSSRIASPSTLPSAGRPFTSMRARLMVATVYIRRMEIVALVHGDGGGPSLFRGVLEGLGATVTDVRLHRGEKPKRGPQAYDAVMSFGGTMHPYEHDAHPWLGAEIAYLEDALAAGVPTLGVCLGAQLLARAAGGEVVLSAEKEIGWVPVELTDAAAGDLLFSALPGRFRS